VTNESVAFQRPPNVMHLFEGIDEHGVGHGRESQGDGCNFGDLRL